MKVLFLALLAIVCINAITTEESFKLWMSKHNKNYNNDAEYMYRLGVFRSNLEFVEEHNKLHKSYSVAMNQFGDLTGLEFAELYNGLNIDATELEQKNVVRMNDNIDLPNTVDWRNQGVVTGVKNQGQCGSCWAFSTTGSLEGQHALKTGKLVSLSEQNLVDCSGSFGNDGCDGGLMDNAFKYIKSNGGIDTEASYPYRARDGQCKFNQRNVGATVTGYTDVQSGSEGQLQQAVANVGPISVAIDASHSSFQFYSGGVYNEPACSSTRLDHGVLAVGYGTQNGDEYWLVKNSWGTGWGLSGYIMMSRDKNNQCGIATMASYPTV